MPNTPRSTPKRDDHKIITPLQYLNSLPADKKDLVANLRKTLLEHLPEGFSEVVQSGMLSYVVPHSLYPRGYHANSKLPLPFISIASQKNVVTLHHLGLYGDDHLTTWFKEAYDKQSKSKLDMGKGCVRFKNEKDIPYQLIGQLASRIPPQKWIEQYEKALQSREKKVSL